MHNQNNSDMLDLPERKGGFLQKRFLLGSDDVNVIIYLLTREIREYLPFEKGNRHIEIYIDDLNSALFKLKNRL